IPTGYTHHLTVMKGGWRRFLLSRFCQKQTAIAWQSLAGAGVAVVMTMSALAIVFVEKNFLPCYVN
ncbi:hypothetical protein AB4Z21_11530, partial [Paenibacillus sp. MCAF20]